MNPRPLTLVAFALASLTSAAPSVAAQGVPRYSRADTLRGSHDTPARAWWDVTFYDLHVAISPRDSTIRGWNAISYRVLQPARTLQIDLMVPLEIDSVVQDGRRVAHRRDGNAFFVDLVAPQPAGAVKTVAVHYHGRPQIARRPPWEGGFSWGNDGRGNAWVVTTDQGMGASVWWPNKDTQADEPDSQRVAITVPDPLINVSNGRLRSTRRNADGTTTFEWFVTNPINNYAIAVAAGNYTHFSELYRGERGMLTLDYWPLEHNIEAARRQFAQTRSMMQCFERWFGPYPWYEDGFKIVEVSNNGMEHQSAIAYGNGYANGYRGRDGSGTGLGMRWDFIIVHESAHEWWGNNITTKDLADMWVHESFANYSEGLYTECLFGKDSGAAYTVGTRRGIRNDRPIIPPAYGVNAQGSGDMYPKGGNMLHTIRQIINDDEKWRGILRGLNETFRHQTVNGRDVEQFISARAGIDLGKVFDQYLRTTMIPVFEYAVEGGTLRYRWGNVVAGFNMHVAVRTSSTGFTRLTPTESWQSTAYTLPASTPVSVDANYYVTAAARRPGSGSPTTEASPPRR